MAEDQPQIVQVPGLGVVAFPPLMPAHEIAAYINRQLANQAGTQAPANGQPLLASQAQQLLARPPLRPGPYQGPEMHRQPLVVSTLPPQTAERQAAMDHARRLYGEDPTLQNAIPPDAGLQAQTLTDKLRDARDTFGQTIAPLLGLDWNAMADEQQRGRLLQMIVAHGSPHLFDAFDASKIGTGEGAQMYGHGLYFAENPEVAKDYYRKFKAQSEHQVTASGQPVGTFVQKPLDFGMAQSEAMKQQFEPHVSRALQEYIYGGFDAKKAEDALNQFLANQSRAAKGENRAYFAARAEESRKALDWLRNNTLDARSRASLYTVDLNDQHIAKMLDWDKPMTQQAPEVQSALQSAGHEIHPDMTGGEFYAQLASGAPVSMKYVDAESAKAASDKLNALGIPGIKYLDGVSRTAAKKTRNFVVFDPDASLSQLQRTTP